MKSCSAAAAALFLPTVAAPAFRPAGADQPASPPTTPALNPATGIFTQLPCPDHDTSHVRLSLPHALKPTVSKPPDSAISAMRP